MATQSKIQHLSRRIEALAAQAKGNFGAAPIMDDPRENLWRRLHSISDRMRETAEERGEPFPPLRSPEERDDIVRRFREFCSSRA